MARNTKLKGRSVMEYVLKDISTVGQLREALDKLPSDAPLNPFGAPNAALVYDTNKKTAYIDDDFSWAEEEVSDSLDSR